VRPFEGGVEALLALADESDATDVHLAAGQPVFVRVASEPRARTEPVSAEDVERIVGELLPPRLAEELEREGACHLSVVRGSRGRCRVQIAQHRTGLEIALRLFPAEIPSLASLGLPEDIASGTRYGQGLVLFA